jgi:NAD+--asparagine ADP-ribosyltransferase
MNTGGLILVIGSLLSATLAFIWVAYKIGGGSHSASKKITPDLEKSADRDVEHIFNDEFREELRNRGRLHFEKIIGENAMFLQQDLRQTTSQLNDYMRAEITRTLQDEFKKYEQSIVDAKQLALDSIEKTITTIEQQRALLEQQLLTQSEAQKAHIVQSFEKEMAGIVNHYVLRAIGNQIDLSDQLEYILAELEANKESILEDVKRGA